MSHERTLVVSVEGKKVIGSKIVEDPLDDVVKKILIEVLPKWSPKDSDLIVMRHEHEVSLKLPLSKELYEALVKYGLRRKSQSEVSAKMPVYVISYVNKWVGDELVDESFYLVAPYVNEDLRREVEMLAKDLTTPESPEEFEE